MMRLTADEKAIVAGVLLSAAVAGIGILELMQATSSATLPSFIWQMIVGSMLFNAGISGVIGCGTMLAVYRAVL
jgi:hypothetical protein